MSQTEPQLTSTMNVQASENSDQMMSPDIKMDTSAVTPSE